MLFKEYQKNWEIEHKTERIEYFRKYREAHKAKAKIDSHNHYIKNKAKTLERTKKNYNDNKEAHNKLTAGYYQKNKANVQEQHRIYYQENKEKVNCQRNERLKIDVGFRIRKNLGGRLRGAIKHGVKSTSITLLIGCSIEFLKNHIQEQFADGMHWDNYGRKKGIKCWEVDHIKPCASFDLSKPQEQRKCFHHTNLQPLWALDNIRKSDKY